MQRQTSLYRGWDEKKDTQQSKGNGRAANNRVTRERQGEERMGIDE